MGCVSKRTGNKIKSYNDIADALYAATRTLEMNGLALVPYQCEDCGMLHLTPEGRKTPSTKCNNCISADGSYKQLYATKQAAQLRADIILQEDGVLLKVYKCGYSNGFHLAKVK